MSAFGSRKPQTNTAGVHEPRVASGRFIPAACAPHISGFDDVIEPGRRSGKNSAVGVELGGHPLAAQSGKGYSGAVADEGSQSSRRPAGAVPTTSAMENDGVLDALLGLTVTDAFSAVAAPLDVPGAQGAGAGTGRSRGSFGGSAGVMSSAIYSDSKPRSSSIDGLRMAKSTNGSGGLGEVGRIVGARTGASVSASKGSSNLVTTNELEEWLDDVLGQS